MRKPSASTGVSSLLWSGYGGEDVLLPSVSSALDVDEDESLRKVGEVGADAVSVGAGPSPSRSRRDFGFAGTAINAGIWILRGAVAPSGLVADRVGMLLPSFAVSSCAFSSTFRKERQSTR